MTNIDWKAITDEATEHLCALVRFDTTNPPGNELACAQYVADACKQEGIEPEVLESEPGRANVIARIKGDGSKKPLLLMSHLDVVHAESSRWEVPPFSGEIRDGNIWGRGTLDTKGLTVMHMMAMFLLKRNQTPLKRDIILMGNADEEAGGRLGAQWMVDNHFDKIEAEFALNEGGVGMEIKGKAMYLCSNAEKGMTWTRLTTRGRPGHASMPHSDNATLHMSKAIEKLSKYRSKITVTDTFRNFARTLSKIDPRGNLLRLIDKPIIGPLLLKLVKDDFIKVMVQTTITPTKINGGVKVNVIPDHCELSVDCRIVPGVSREDLRRMILDLVDSDKVELDFEIFSAASESPIDTELYSTIEKVIAANHAGAVVSPFMMPGGTDSRFMRAKGIPAYGFVPAVLSREDIASIHGDNEKISIEALSSGLRVIYDVVAEMCT
jgi:acetylornithine deacetylase/succinyl-diaminopimelate desuccinylase-like protein